MDIVNELGASAQGNGVIDHRRMPRGFEFYREDDGTPIVAQFRGGLAYRAELEEFIELAREYLEAFSDRDILHNNNKLCGVENCAECEQVKLRIKLDTLLNGKFAMCRGVKNQSGYVYALRSGELYKIGVSVNPRSRLKQVEKKTGQSAELVHSIKTLGSFELEFYWHRRFAAYHETGEWFRLPQHAIDEFCSYEAMEATV